MLSWFGKRLQTALLPGFKNSNLNKRKFALEISIENEMWRSC